MYKMLYTFTYMAIGSMTPLIGYYLNGLGFSGSQIGVVTATGTAVAVFAVLICIIASVSTVSGIKHTNDEDSEA